MPNFEEHVELDLFKINGQYWALRDKDGDNQLQVESDMSYINQEYKVDWLGSIKIPLEYLEQYQKEEVWYR